MSLIDGAFDAYHSKSQEEDADDSASVERELAKGEDGGR
jgi:hypothetical protein